MSTQIPPTNSLDPTVGEGLTVVSGTAHAFQEIIAATNRIFDGQVTVRTDHDPTHPQESFIVLAVEAEGDVARLLDLEEQWVTAVQGFHRHWPGLRLSIRLK